MSSKKRSRTSVSLPQKTPRVIVAFHTIALLAVIVTPLLISTSFVELFEFPKLIFVYTLTIAAIVVTAAWWYQQRKITVVRTVADLPLAIFLLLLSLATAFSIDRYVSIVGYYSRFNGSWLSYICCAILFYVVLIDTAVVQPGDTQQAKRRRQLLWGWVASLGVVSLIAVLHYFQQDPLCLIINQTLSNSCWPATDNQRVFSTLGQSNTLASYLISGLPLAIVLLLTTAKEMYRWLLLAVISAASLALLYTLSRAGWLGLVAEVAVLGVFVSKETLRKRRWWMGGLVIIWAAILLLNMGIFTQRVSETLSPQELPASTAKTRSLVWQGAEQVIIRHPWLGTGPETFIYSFLPYRSRDLNDTVEWNAVYDKAHNELLQLATGMGIPAAIAWITIFVSPLLLAYRYRLWLFADRWPLYFDRYLNPARLLFLKQLRPNHSEPMGDETDEAMPPLLMGGLLASYIGVIVSLLLAFSTITLNILLFIALALAVAPSAKVRVWTWPPQVVRILATISGLVVLVLIYLLGRYTIADWYIQAAQNAAGQGNMQQATADFGQAVMKNPDERVYRLALSNVLAQDGANQKGVERQTTLTKSNNLVQQALNQGPIGDVVLVRAIDTYTYLAEQDPKYVPLLGQLVAQGNVLIPSSANMARFSANFNLAYGPKDKAKTEFDRLVHLRPLAGDSYLQRAAWYRKYDQPDLARRDLSQAMKLSANPGDPVYQQAEQQLKQMESSGS